MVSTFTPLCNYLENMLVELVCSNFGKLENHSSGYNKSDAGFESSIRQ